MVQDLERLDWNNLSDDDLSELESRLKAELSLKEQSDIDMILWGKLVLFKAKSLSLKVNNEILSVVAGWLDDQDMLVRYRIEDERVYDWAAIKRRQRRYDCVLQAERLRLYWERVRKKRDFISGLGELIRKSGAAGLPASGVGNGFFDDLLSPFSPVAEAERELETEFGQFMDRHVVHRLPWKQLIISDFGVNQEKQLSALAAHTSFPRMELVAKLSTLLQMEQEGVVGISQAEPFDDPIVRLEAEIEPHIMTKNREGEQSAVRLDQLTEAEKTAFITKIKDGEIICM